MESEPASLPLSHKTLLNNLVIITLKELGAGRRERRKLSKNPFKASVIMAQERLWYVTVLLPCGRVLV